MSIVSENTPEQLPTGASGASALEVAQRAARAAGDIIRERFGHARIAAVKGRGNILTETDLEAEQAILAIVRAEFPEHTIIAEESSPDAIASGWTWVIDPLDGTKNFSMGIPHICVSIALCRDGEPVLGVIRQPVLGEEFVGVEGQGATVDGVAIRAGTASSVAEGVVSIDLGYDELRGGRQLELARSIFPNVQSMRYMGSAALGVAYAAAGRFDLFIHSDLYPWDVAAGLIIAREAGACATGRDGSPSTIMQKGIVVGGERAHADFLQRYGALPWQD